ncbi:MAG: RdgB/HAM1 family non-canonical purine NTP pyrophosphatase [Ignavibacteria bacterium]|nr:RdgB/HAM1 family non-canonical purine NTP pyrophosphatase [Ignavibacteria bacterium]
MKTLVLATRNKDKITELKLMLDGLHLDIRTLDHFPAIGELVEDADTLEGNALRKAREVHRVTQLPSLADDSGLEVGYLVGAPGVRSSRYAGPNATYADNCKELLRNMLGVPARRRGARFRCVLAFVGPDTTEKLAEGSIEGKILEEPRGKNGFGYDPVFVPKGQQQTFAEMAQTLKNALSHRARALEHMREFLQQYFQTQ